MVDVVKFKETVKHGRFQFIAGTVCGFEDVDAAPYFIGAGWAEASKDEPAVVYTVGEVDIDPNTVHGTVGHPLYGKKVLNPDEDGPSPSIKGATTK